MTHREQMLFNVLKSLVAQWEAFCTCNDGCMGNHGDAYNYLAKQSFRTWESAREQVAMFETEEATKDRIADAHEWDARLS